MVEQLEFNLEEPQPTQTNPESAPILPLVLSLTGNPWTDFGIVSFCEELRFASFLEDLGLTPHEAIITVDNVDVETVGEWLNQMFRERWNQLYWLSRGAKILEYRTLIRDDDGFVNQDLLKIQTTESDRAQIKAKWASSTVKGEMSLTQWRFNFIGTSRDAKSLRDKQREHIRDFIQNWTEPVGKKVCETSGRHSAKLKDLLQVVNPFANKHHNTKVRGALASSVTPKIGPLYYLINLCATLDDGIPFVYDVGKQVTRLILPDIPDLALLSKVYARLKENLRDDLREKELYPYTNLRVRLQMSNRYALALTLFHNVFYQFTPDEEQETEGGWDFSPLVEESGETVKQLTRWVVIPFTKGQVVNFQNFHTVEVNARLYDFIKPIDCKPQEIKLVPDILGRMKPKPRSPDGENALGQLSEAIATSTPYLLKTALFSLWKHTDAVTFVLRRGAPHPLWLLRPFINHFLEVNQVLTRELREDLRALGTTIGNTFHADVTLISKVFNISSASAFRETLNVVMNRLYKKSTDPRGKGLFPVKQERVTRILDGLTDEHYKEMAETLSTYVSLAAYNANVSQSKSDNDGGQNG